MSGLQTILVRREGWRLRVTLNRPELRNALSAEMVDELSALFDGVRDDRSVRAIVLRGAGGTFCAGGDIKGFGEGQQAGRDFLAQNRRYGALLDRVNEAPQAVVAAIEGAVRGGGMGFACASDVAIATERASFGLPEATLGLPAAQVCALVAERIGLTQARMLAVTGASFRAPEALKLGLIHHVVADAAGLDARVEAVLAEIGRCEASAIAETKRILHLSRRAPRSDVVAAAAESFAAAMASEAAREGVAAFVGKRAPDWAKA